MKKYVIELDDDLSNVYEDIAKMNNKKVEETKNGPLLQRAVFLMAYPGRLSGILSA